MYTLKNFKNFATAEITRSSPVTVLIGKNDSGKTNAIEAMELLANLASGRPLHEISDLCGGTDPSAFRVRGGLAACARAGTTEFELGYSAAIKSPGAKTLHYRITVEVRPEPRISSELLSMESWIGERRVFEGRLQAPDIGSRLSVQWGESSNSKAVSADQSVLSRYIPLSLGEHGVPSEQRDDALGLVSVITNSLRGSIGFEPNPQAMRCYERIGQRDLLRDGSNLSAVLYELHSRDDSTRDTLARIIDTIKQILDEPFDDIGFDITSQGSVRFGVHPKMGAKLFDARVLADGTLSSLAVLTALETVPVGSKVVIERYDNSVHPSRVGILWAALWECSERRHLNVLVTTQNPAALNALTKEQLNAVVLCAFDPLQGAGRTLTLKQVPDYDLIVFAGQLGDLVAGKELDLHLLPNFREMQKQAALHWLKAMRK